LASKEWYKVQIFQRFMTFFYYHLVMNSGNPGFKGENKINRIL